MPDFSGDGKLDLVVANYGSNDVSLLLNAGRGSVAAANNFPVGKSPTAVVVGDLDGDHKLDVATADYWGGQVTLLLGSVSGNLSSPIPLDVAPSPFAMTLAISTATSGPIC